MAKKAATKTTDQYIHTSTRRLNLPTEQTSKTMSDADRRPILYKPETREIDDDPILAWNRQPADAGSHAAHPLYIREKVHPAAFVKLLEGTGEQPQLFSDFNGLPSADAAYEWYQHAANWSNRLIHGESARVMASLLARESMAGKVQMIYFDPPYGMGYKSNFQVSVSTRETAESAKGRPHDTRTIRAFRDTYERGIHSYLDLTHEKLVLMRELLAESGSLFMQIGDENVHRAAILLDEVFGADNRVATIPFATASSSASSTLPSVADFLLWYAKNKNELTYQQIYERLTRAEIVELFSSYAMVELPDGTTRTLTPQERSAPGTHLPKKSRIYKRSGLISQGTSTTGRSEPYRWNNNDWKCPTGWHWSVSMNGLDRLAELGRLDAVSSDSQLSWKKYEDEVPGRSINNIWHRQMYAGDKRYVVQTADRVIERCILMATSPGDLVLDPTCGGGTTALAAEKWGRRWITCDTSPVAVSIARQRLSTAVFPYWTLADSQEGARHEAQVSGKQPEQPEGGWGNDPAGGFVYERIPYVSAGTLAYDLDPEPIMLVDRPHKKRGVTRVASPLTVESEQPWATVIPLEGTDDELVVAHDDFLESVQAALLGHTIDGGRENADMTIRALEPWPSDSNLLAWKATYTINGGAAEHVAAVLVAAEDVTVPGEMVREAARDITDSAQRADVLLVVAYAFAADAPNKVGKFTVARTQMNRDLMIRELSDEKGHQAFVIIGEPDIKIIDYPNNQIAVEVRGYDTFDPATGNASEGGPNDVACWMIDTDHDSESFFARRIHFPGADDDKQIKRLIDAIGKNADDVEREALTAMRSAPFDAPERGRIAVKIVTATGMEMTSVRGVA